MKSSNLQSYISKRIRHLRLQQGLTQEQLEEKAELPQKYAYRLERQEPNIKIATLEKIMIALDTDIESFFEIRLNEQDPLVHKLFDILEELPQHKKEKILTNIINIIEETL